MRPRFQARAGPRVLGVLLWIPLALGMCYLPVSPGCNPGESLPRDENLVVIFGVATEQGGGASFALAATGRSQFRARYTLWTFSTVGSCRQIPEATARRLRGLWRSVGESADKTPPARPSQPFLWIRYLEGDATRLLFVKPGGDSSSDLAHAAALTLRVFQETYGDRVLRELRAAGLEELLQMPSAEEHVNSNP